MKARGPERGRGKCHPLGDIRFSLAGIGFPLAGARSYVMAMVMFVAMVALPGRAAELVASGIAVPFFNEAGKLTHKMVAARGATSGDLRRLEEVEIAYFSLTEPNTIVQKVTADEAVWDEKKEILTGTRSIVVATEENRLTGEGFDFALATSRLNIHREFRMENREMILTSDRATAELLMVKSGENRQVRDVKWCDAEGNLRIVVQPTATREYELKEARSDVAHYDGVARTVTLPKAIQGVRRNGQPAVFDHLLIKLGPAKTQKQAAKQK